jgi:4-cresol dehydrogenase (hydroxylating)
LTTLYGDEGQISANLKILREAFAAVGGLVITEHELPKDKPSPLGHFAMNQKGKLNLHEFGIYNYRGGGGSAWFSPALPARGEDMIRSIKLCEQVYSEFGFDYIGGFIFGYSGRHVDHITDLLFDRSNPEEMKRANSCFEKLLKVHAEAGYAPYRINTGFMKQVAQLYGPGQMKLNKRIKKALDPNGILAPGKSGIY